MQAQAEQPRVRRYWWLALLLVILSWIGWRWIFGSAPAPFSQIITPHDVGMLSPIDEAHRHLQRILDGELLPEELQQVLADYTEAVERIRTTLPPSEFQDWKRNEQHIINQATIDQGLRQRLLVIVEPTSVTPFIGPSATPTATATSTSTPTSTATSIPTLILPPLFPIVRPTATQAVPIPPSPSAIPTLQTPTILPTTLPTPPRPTATNEPLPTEIPLPSITPLPSPLRSTPLPEAPTSGPYPYPYPSGE